MYSVRINMVDSGSDNILSDSESCSAWSSGHIRFDIGQNRASKHESNLRQMLRSSTGLSEEPVHKFV